MTTFHSELVYLGKKAHKFEDLWAFFYAWASLVWRGQTAVKFRCVTLGFVISLRFLEHGSEFVSKFYADVAKPPSLLKKLVRLC